MLKTRLSIGLMIIISAVGCSAAFAGNNEDYFSRSTSSISMPTTTTARIPNFPAASNKPPQVVWYQSFDAQVSAHSAKADEKVLLTKGFGNPPQLERVIAWQNTAATVAKKYRDLSRILNNMPIPSAMRQDPQSRDVEEYKQQLADWYADSATWLEDYIKPRRPARTQEELEAALRQMHDRSENLKLTMTHLEEMDSKLRDHFNVQSSVDALMDYVKKPLQK